MSFPSLAFYSFAIVLVLAGLGVITSRNPVHAAMCLVLSFVTAAALWMLLFAEFLAITLVLVYVGAVMVLFLFVVMMLDINFDKLREGFRNNAFVAALVGFAMLAEMAILLMSRSFGLSLSALPGGPAAGASNTKELGRVLYTDYVLPFELAAVVLLVAMVAAIALTLRPRRESKTQDINAQVRVKSSDRLKIIKMDATKETPAATAPVAAGEATPQ